MRTKWRVAMLLAATALALGCGGSSANQPAAIADAPPTVDNDDAMAGLTEHHRFHHHGGATQFIVMGLDTLGVSPDHRAAVQKLQADLQAALAPARTAEQNVTTALADGLAAARFDAATMDTALANVTQAAAAVDDASVDPLDQLHAVLTPPERAALVDKLEAHWAVWRKVNPDHADVATSGDFLARDLALTPDQTTQLHSALAAGMNSEAPLDRLAIDARLRAFGDAFRGEHFDAKALGPSNANAQLASWGTDHMVHVIEIVSPLLTADQRAALVASLREHATNESTTGGTP